MQILLGRRTPSRGIFNNATESTMIKIKPTNDKPQRFDSYH